MSELQSAAYRIQIFPRWSLRGKRWHFRIRARNGQIVAQSEAYHNMTDCVQTAAHLRGALIEAPMLDWNGEEMV